MLSKKKILLHLGYFITTLCTSCEIKNEEYISDSDISDNTKIDASTNDEDNDITTDDSNSIYENITIIDGGYASKLTFCEGGEFREKAYQYYLEDDDSFPAYSFLRDNEFIISWGTRTIGEAQDGGELYKYVIIKIDIQKGYLRIFESEKLGACEGATFHWSHNGWFMAICEYGYRSVVFREGEWGTEWNYTEPFEEVGGVEGTIELYDIKGDKIVYNNNNKFYCYDIKSKELLEIDSKVSPFVKTKKWHV